ncbi:hypothetical protein MMC12_000486 [Toensbergia leucococca]|nr:hypothetical protein [Toensbergia leucococca]
MFNAFRTLGKEIAAVSKRAKVSRPRSSRKTGGTVPDSRERHASAFSRSQPFPFLDLPPEIRNQVYLHVWSMACHQTQILRTPTVLLSNLLRTNKQIYDEATYILYSKLFFHAVVDRHDWPTGINPRVLSKIYHYCCRLSHIPEVSKRLPWGIIQNLSVTIYTHRKYFSEQTQPLVSLARELSSVFCRRRRHKLRYLEINLQEGNKTRVDVDETLLDSNNSDASYDSDASFQEYLGKQARLFDQRRSKLQMYKVISDLLRPFVEDVRADTVCLLLPESQENNKEMLRLKRHVERRMMGEIERMEGREDCLEARKRVNIASAEHLKALEHHFAVVAMAEL